MIDNFMKEYRFLSNFHLAPVEMDGVLYPSTEHAYQAAKTLDLELRKEVVDMTCGSAKRWGQQIKLRPDWEQVKISVMETLVRQKFTRHTDLRDRLLATGDQELIEGNTWNDTFWGVCKGKGTNHLDKILMKIRTELQL